MSKTVDDGGAAMSDKVLEGMARKDHLMHRMFVEYNRHLADCMHDKKSVGDRDREDAMAKAVQFLADNVSDEMVDAHSTTYDKVGLNKTHEESVRQGLAAALRQAAGGGE